MFYVVFLSNLAGALDICKRHDLAGRSLLWRLCPLFHVLTVGFSPKAIGAKAGTNFSPQVIWTKAGTNFSQQAIGTKACTRLSGLGSEPISPQASDLVRCLSLRELGAVPISP